MNTSTKTVIKDSDDFKEKAKEVIKLVDQDDPQINKAIDLVFAMRHWFLDELLRFMPDTPEEVFKKYSLILENLDKLIGNAFTKVSVKNFVSDDKK